MVSWSQRVWFWALGPMVSYSIQNPERALLSGYIFGHAWRQIGLRPTMGFIFRFGLVVPWKVSSLLWNELLTWAATTPGGKRLAARTATKRAAVTAARAGATAHIARYAGGYALGGAVTTALIVAALHTAALQKYGLVGPEAPTMFIASNEEWRKKNPDDPLAQAKINPYMISLGSVV